MYSRLLLEEKLSAELTDEVATAASNGCFTITPHPSRLAPCHLPLKGKAMIVPFDRREEEKGTGYPVPTVWPYHPDRNDTLKGEQHTDVSS